MQFDRRRLINTFGSKRTPILARINVLLENGYIDIKILTTEETLL